MKTNKRKIVRNKYNTPGIIKYPFWRMTAENPRAVYACVNAGEACAPREVEDRAVCIEGDIREVIDRLSDNGDGRPAPAFAGLCRKNRGVPRADVSVF